MTFAGINYLAVLVAAIGSFVFGAVWYSTLSKPWMAAARVTKEDISTEGFAGKVPFIVAGVSQLLIAFFLAGVMGHLARVDITGGLTTAFFLWLGFVVTTMAVNHRFQNFGWNLTVIDGGHWLGGMLIQGLIIGAFGV